VKSLDTHHTVWNVRTGQILLLGQLWTTGNHQRVQPGLFPGSASRGLRCGWLSGTGPVAVLRRRASCGFLWLGRWTGGVSEFTANNDTIVQGSSWVWLLTNSGEVNLNSQKIDKKVDKLNAGSVFVRTFFFHLIFLSCHFQRLAARLSFHQS